ncbi:MAG: TrmB family transcriptional regulator [Alphaproteobacteria bacterium]|nr:TrmB family transcriptional regulator [Alphaproteobacteria bacterium]MCB9795355.1 TrmB family transcriptional regulator [Alphaproteobacteria bacterium]
MNSTVVAHLTDLGLTRNEALAYLTLLEDEGGEGLTGYEVAARSGIPRSAVYTVLRKLEGNGGAFSYGSEPARFSGTPPEQFVEQFRRATLSQLDATAEALRSLPERPRPEPVWILSRYEEVMGRVDAMIRGAERSVYLSLWPRELEWLAPALEAIADRDLHRVLHSPAALRSTPPGFSVWAGDIDGDATKATWSHKALVVVDRREALIGGTEPEAENHAVRTTNPSLVDVATNHIILDITLMARESGRDCVPDVAPMMRPHLGRGDK